MTLAKTFDTWGEPIYANTDSMQGPAQISEAAKLAIARGIRHFDTQALLLAATGMLVDYYAIVKNIPGVLWRYDGVSAWVPSGTASFVSASARDAAITSPPTGMITRIDTERFPRRYNGSAWKPWGASRFPIIPASVAGSGVSLGGDGKITAAAAAAISINGIGTADFDNIAIAARLSGASAAVLAIRGRTSGSDDAGSNYIGGQVSYATTTPAVTFATTTSLQIGRAHSSATAQSINEIVLAGLNLAQATDILSRNADVVAFAQGGGAINTVTQYDGVTIFAPVATNLSGGLTVEGWNND